MTDAKGKPCSTCGAPMTDLSSQFRRQCTNGKCAAIESWPLDDRQKPLITTNRDTRR